MAGEDFSLAYSPERIDPGTGRGLRDTPKLVAGVSPADTAVAAAFYGTLVDQVVRTSSPRQAEMAKLIENTFRQVNIALVNELATIAPAIGVDIWEALDAAATKPFGYMPFWPGPGVGGHCIAIDPSYLSWQVEQHLGFGIGFVEHARTVNNRMPAPTWPGSARPSTASGGPWGAPAWSSSASPTSRASTTCGSPRRSTCSSAWSPRAPTAPTTTRTCPVGRCRAAAGDVSRGRPRARHRGPAPWIRCRCPGPAGGRRLRRDPDRPSGHRLRRRGRRRPARLRRRGCHPPHRADTSCSFDGECAEAGQVPAGRPRRSPGPAARVAAVIAVYAVAILGFVWLTKDLTFATLTRDPLFAGYSIAVVIYVLGRFVGALFYRPVPDRGYRPTVSVIVPAFNEEDGIIGTIESCLAVDYPGTGSRSSSSTTARPTAPGSASSRPRPAGPSSTPSTSAATTASGAPWPRASAGPRARSSCFVDSDSYLEPDAVTAIVQPFADDRVGAVVGHADVRNGTANWITKMQQVRYYSAFRVIKGTESLLSGTVTCASGCCAAYRAAAVLPLLDEWEFQTFLGRPATFGDDRALTNRVLSRHRVVYQSTARAETVVPEHLRVFFRQQLRWKKSWLRETLYVVRYFWRKNPLAALFTYASIAFPFMAPFVVLHAVGGRVIGGSSRACGSTSSAPTPWPCCTRSTTPSGATTASGSTA